MAYLKFLNINFNYTISVNYQFDNFMFIIADLTAFLTTTNLRKNKVTLKKYKVVIHTFMLIR